MSSGVKARAVSTPACLTVARELRECPTIATIHSDVVMLDVVQGDRDVWLRFGRRGSPGGLAVRAMTAPARWDSVTVTVTGDLALRLNARSAAGRHRVEMEVQDAVYPSLHWSTWLTPAAPLRAPVVERDLFPLGAGDDPSRSEGEVLAAQRGQNTALLFAAQRQPQFGLFLYLQDLTALNPLFEQLDSPPDGVVGGLWPELGFLPTKPVLGGQREGRPLDSGVETMLAKGHLLADTVLDRGPERHPLVFLRLLAAAYPHLEKQPPVFHDWPSLARRTITDLERSPDASVTYRGRRYIRPYTAAEYPDAMVQASLAANVHEFSRWSGEPFPLAGRLASGMPAFFDDELGIVRRYLPNVGDDKDPDAVDSWYLYHPLVNLARMAIHGDRAARKLFEGSLDYAVGVARHFDYEWPIQYNIRDWSVIEQTRGNDGQGQTDTNGIYAYVMLLAFLLTDDISYVDEAAASIDASVHSGFDLQYQANITAIGAAACVWLWRITSEPRFLDRCYAYLATFLHNTNMWESQLGNARFTTTFFSPTCLHDASYTAAYETYDSFLAFDDVLRFGGTGLDPAVRLLLSEYCAYAPDSTWSAYPENLPPASLADSSRNGHIDRELAFPLEDIYPDGQAAGQVGQEIYGAAAGLAYAHRLFHVDASAPFTVFCDRRTSDSNVEGHRTWVLHLEGPPEVTANVVLLLPRTTWPRIKVTANGEPVTARQRSSDRREYRVPGDSVVRISW